MPACAHCAKNTEKLNCGKCRGVVYCNATCQNADWKEHKETCKPSVTYVSNQIRYLYDSCQWRKLLKWSSYLNPLLELIDDDGQRILLNIFKDANQMGSNATIEAVYSSNMIPILEKMIILDEKEKRYEKQGILLCELGQCFHFLRNDIEEMACYIRAIEIGDKHGIASVKCVGNFGVGRIFTKIKWFLEAKPLLRIALEAAESEETDYMHEHAILCSDELCTVLFNLNSIDEAEPIIKRFPTLVQKTMKKGSQLLQHKHLINHILLARLHEAKNRPEEAKSEIYKMLSLIDANKDAIHDFRPSFIHLLDRALENLRILQDTDIGDLQLAKAVCRLKTQQIKKICSSE